MLGAVAFGPEELENKGREDSSPIEMGMKKSLSMLALLSQLTRNSYNQLNESKQQKELQIYTTKDNLLMF